MADQTVASPTRVCTKCSAAKPATLEFFPGKSDTKSRLHSWCRVCVRAANRSWMERNPDVARASVKASKARNRGAILERQRAAYDPDAARIKRKEWRERNLEADRERGRQKAAARRERDRDAARKYHREYLKARRATDPRFNLLCGMRSLISAAVRGKGGKGGRGWEVLVGYALDDLMRHLERQFARGMTWENYGAEWHIDHIRPASSFSIASADCPEFRACWALTNLRPLWAADNLRKHATRTHLL